MFIRSKTYDNTMTIPEWHDRFVPLSWTLWWQLLNPHESAVFMRVIDNEHQYRLTLFHFSLMLAGGIGLSFGVVNYLRPLALEFPVIALVVLTIFSSIITIVWLISIATKITQEYQRETLDLVCVTPSGQIGAYWSIATGILHRQDLFRWIHSIHRWLSGFVLLFFASALVPVVISSIGEGTGTSQEATVLVLEVLLFVVCVYAGHVQTVLPAILIAMLIPRIIRRATDVTIWGIFIFVTLQIMMMTVFLVGGGIANLIFIENAWLPGSIIPQLLVLYLIREVVIHALWKLLSLQLDTNIDDVKQL